MTIHAQQRALERYNSDLTKHDLEQMCTLIKSNQHIPISVCDENKNKKFCYVKYKKIPYKVLYHNSKTKVKIITIYPLDVDEYNSFLEAKDLARITGYIKFLKERGYIVYRRSK